jgi:hypothetical protein
MQALIVSRPSCKVQEVHWNRHLAMDGSALADLRRKNTLTDRKEVHAAPFNTLHGEFTLNRHLCSCADVVESQCKDAGTGPAVPIGDLCGVQTAGLSCNDMKIWSMK